MLQTFFTPGLAINSYMVFDPSTRHAIVIDPTRAIEPYLRYALQENLQITDIVETHVHADFISGAKELKQRLHGQVIIHCSAMGGNEWIPKYADRHVKDKDEIHLGSIRLKALHTPGHTPEHIIWLCYDENRSHEIPCLAFTGDLLFVGGIGRPDLLGTQEVKKLSQQLHHSLFTTLAQLPDFIEIFPAHSAGSLCGKGLSTRSSSTLGYERLFNPAFKSLSIGPWLDETLRDIPAAPIRFKWMKQMNLQGLKLSTEEASDGSVPLLIDVRSPESFAKEHIKNAINIPFGSSFCNWVSSIVADDCPVGIVAETTELLTEAMKNLNLIGLDNISKKILWKEDAKDYELEKMPLVSVEEIATTLQGGSEVLVLDVRTPSEWKSGHIKNARHIELSLLSNELHQLPKDAAIRVTCGSGYRSSIAASALKRAGFTDVANIRGGMSAWYRAKLPIISD